MTASPRLVLASGSPRRREILQQLGLEFVVQPSAVDEPAPGDETPAEYATRLARMKARDVADRRDDGALVLGADTIVVVGDDVLGKPADVAEARAMLERLSGRAHEVITGVSLVGAGSVDEAFHVCTRVVFRALDAEVRARYADSGEGLDKAGAYAIQGLGAGLVSRIEGSYSNVVGLPAAEVLECLAGAAGVGWP